jgi:hypothetical protein
MPAPDPDADVHLIRFDPGDFAEDEFWCSATSGEYRNDPPPLRSRSRFVRPWTSILRKVSCEACLRAAMQCGHDAMLALREREEAAGVLVSSVGFEEYTWIPIEYVRLDPSGQTPIDPARVEAYLTIPRDQIAPLVVSIDPTGFGFAVQDGRHRFLALQRLGYEEVRCVGAVYDGHRTARADLRKVVRAADALATSGMLTPATWAQVVAEIRSGS